MKLSLCKNNNPAQDFKWVVSSFSEHRRMQRCKDDEGNLWCSPLFLPPAQPSIWGHTLTHNLHFIVLHFTLYSDAVHCTVCAVHVNYSIWGQTHCFAFLCMLCFTNAFYFASQCFASLRVYKELVQLCKHLKLYNSGL